MTSQLSLRRRRHRGPRRAVGFTLVELMVVVGVIAILIGVLLPALVKARQASARAKCLSNVRQLCVAQAVYAATYRNALVAAGEGSTDLQGSWITLLEGKRTVHLARRCPADFSRYFSDEPLPGSPPPPAAPLYRTTSYAINNYVSPTHAPTGVTPPSKITQVRRSSQVIQFAELIGTGTYAGSDHIHVQDFYLAAAPNLTPGLIAKQLPIGLHGGVGQRAWQSLLNYGFIDGHAETLAVRDVYFDPNRNKFDPTVAQ